MKIKKKLLYLFSALIICFYWGCNESYIVVFNTNSAILNETAYLLTSEFNTINASNTCSAKTQKSIYISKNNYLECYSYYPAKLQENLKYIFENNLATTISSNINYAEFIWKQTESAGISTLYIFHYQPNDIDIYIENLKKDENAKVEEINSQWFYIVYENDD